VGTVSLTWIEVVYFASSGSVSSIKLNVFSKQRENGIFEQKMFVLNGFSIHESFIS